MVSPSNTPREGAFLRRLVGFQGEDKRYHRYSGHSAQYIKRSRYREVQLIKVAELSQLGNTCLQKEIFNKNTTKERSVYA